MRWHARCFSIGTDESRIVRMRNNSDARRDSISYEVFKKFVAHHWSHDLTLTSQTI